MYSPMSSTKLLLATALACAAVPLARSAQALPEADIAAFTDRHCSSCHNDVDKEGGLDLTSLKYTPDDPANFATWIKVHDRVQTGEMPPKEKKRPPAGEISTFVKSIASALVASEEQVVAREGRATRRRLNRAEYESALRDLLGAPWLQVKDQLPEDGEAFRFNKVSNALDVSYVHMTRYMSAADYAMRQAMAVQLVRPPTTKQRFMPAMRRAASTATPRALAIPGRTGTSSPCSAWSRSRTFAPARRR
jgi:hypothetical protein